MTKFPHETGDHPLQASRTCSWGTLHQRNPPRGNAPAIEQFPALPIPAGSAPTCGSPCACFQAVVSEELDAVRIYAGRIPRWTLEEYQKCSTDGGAERRRVFQMRPCLTMTCRRECCPGRMPVSDRPLFRATTEPGDPQYSVLHIFNEPSFSFGCEDF